MEFYRSCLNTIMIKKNLIYCSDLNRLCKEKTVQVIPLNIFWDEMVSVPMQKAETDFELLNKFVLKTM